MSEYIRISKTVKLSDIFTDSKTQFNLRTTGLSNQDYDDNIVHHYMDYLFDGAYFVTFDNIEKAKYTGDPKKLSHVLFSTTDFFFIIMAMNNFREYADMDLYSLKGIYIPSEARMSFLQNLIERKINSGIVLMEYDDE